jgi:glyoxylase-like metal-dependent hydrolase (beta-lactamase superfamily II)
MLITALPPIGEGQYRYKNDTGFYIDPTNCYLIQSDLKNVAITDAPGDVDFILRFLSLRGLTLKKILLTHGHFEHIFALKELAEKTEAEVYIHPAEKSAITDNKMNFIDYVGALDYEPYQGELTLVEDGDEIMLDEVKIRVIHIPGHSPGSVCYIAGNAIFSGDTLSHNAVGHHNMPYGSREDMFSSLKKLAAIAGDYEVYPAHWTTTTLTEEKTTNLSALPNVYLSHTVLLG